MQWPQRSESGAGVRRGLLAGLAVLAFMLPHFGAGSRFAPKESAAEIAVAPLPSGTSRPTPPQATPRPSRFADFRQELPSQDARYVANWIADSRDNGNTAFVIIDKKRAKLYLFDASARLRGASPILIGAARGDDSVPGIGSRPIAKVRPAERTTPAGRFVAERGHDVDGDDVVWVDYDAAFSMHRVVTNNPKERRLARLATPTIDDNRISYGCINVPRAFYERYIRPTFATHRAVVYVLPEVKPVQQVFGSYDVAARARAMACSGPACGSRPAGATPASPS